MPEVHKALKGPGEDNTVPAHRSIPKHLLRSFSGEVKWGDGQGWGLVVPGASE